MAWCVLTCTTGCCQRPGRWLSLLDAAKFAGTNPLDLSRHDADFVVVSFYKMFGFPTGLGCLLVKRDIAPVLQQRFVSGGTVAAIAATELFHEFRPGMDALHDCGTIRVLSCLSICLSCVAVGF
jgi:molybdenum cofactor sulfurtransferase